MQIFIGLLTIIVNFILYLSFGSVVTIRKKTEKWSLPMTLITGFFLYYGLFSIVCLPIMLTYRPLSYLSRVWLMVVSVVVIIAVLFNAQKWGTKSVQLVKLVKDNLFVSILVGVLLLIQLILVCTTYNFTLDAAYYVANVSTSVDTNMINVYDPFTGAWQDHFELRYVFATYSICDAVICQITGLKALIETKFVMSAIVMLLTNVLYLWIVKYFCADNKKQGMLMYVLMIFVNLTFISLYTSSNFLMTRTYEGKSIVGNIAVIAVFAIYMLAVRENLDGKLLAMLFVICFGTATVSSTANMLIPAEVFVLFAPYIIKRKNYRIIPKVVLCIVPEMVMLLMYVMYVKGYFAIYTYPR